MANQLSAGYFDALYIEWSCCPPRVYCLPRTLWARHNGFTNKHGVEICARHPNWRFPQLEINEVQRRADRLLELECRDGEEVAGIRCRWWTIRPRGRIEWWMKKRWRNPFDENQTQIPWEWGGDGIEPLFAEMRNKTRMLHAEAKDHCRLFKNIPRGDFVQFWAFSCKVFICISRLKVRVLADVTNLKTKLPLCTIYIIVRFQ